MEINQTELLLVTGATGLVGSHVVQQAVADGIPVRTIVRQNSNTDWLDSLGVEQVTGDLADRNSLHQAVDGVTLLVHCAAKVGDWGPVDDYRAVNVAGLENLLDAVKETGRLRKMVHISSLGVYEARDHYGTDETEPPSPDGIDGYTLTKSEAEALIRRRITEQELPAVILRPGFIYGPRDRTVLPRLLERIESGSFAYLGSGEQLMNNTFAGNLVDAIFLALANDEAIGETFNITDGRLVSKREFISTTAKLAGLPEPTRKVPLGFARLLAKVLEGTYRLLGKPHAPLLSNARIKFLGLNLDFCIDKARRELGYEPKVDFTDGIAQTIQWWKSTQEPAGLKPSRAA